MDGFSKILSLKVTGSTGHVLRILSEKQNLVALLQNQQDAALVFAAGRSLDELKAARSTVEQSASDAAEKLVAGGPLKSSSPCLDL
ncbi:hypothetical protein LIER_33435 [Lithospermum erythrorhizon]|uniref:Uncharacterized protein n=1 Tax=Lithospermum erythrorhizon TaxID=34254 RepID=A0AAV3S0T8_LITER